MHALWYILFGLLGTLWGHCLAAGQYMYAAAGVGASAVLHMAHWAWLTRTLEDK